METCQKNRKKTWLHQQMGEPNIWVGGPNIWGPNPRGAEYLAAESEFPNHGNGKREPDSYHTSKPPTQITRISNNKKTKRSNTMDSGSIRSLNKFQMRGKINCTAPNLGRVVDVSLYLNKYSFSLSNLETSNSLGSRSGSPNHIDYY